MFESRVIQRHVNPQGHKQPMSSQPPSHQLNAYSLINYNDKTKNLGTLFEWVLTLHITSWNFLQARHFARYILASSSLCWKKGDYNITAKLGLHFLREVFIMVYCVGWDPSFNNVHCFTSRIFSCTGQGNNQYQALITCLVLCTFVNRWLCVHNFKILFHLS